MDRPRTSAPQQLLARLGRRVRAARGRLGWTLKELAERAALSRRFLSDLEAGRGNISVARLHEVARALDVPLARLMERMDPEDGATAARGGRAALLDELLLLSDAELAEALRFARARARGGAAARRDAKIALVGLRGAGKTTIGRRVARRLALPFVELDREVESAAGMPLAELFSLHGEPYYRRLEREVLAQVLARRGPALLATGGGVVSHPESWALLKGSCFTIWLSARPEDHWRRVVAQGDQRPMRGKPQAMAELRALLEERRRLYETAHLRIDTSALGLSGAVAAVLAALDGR